MVLDTVHRFIGEAALACGNRDLQDSLARLSAALGFTFYSLARQNSASNAQMAAPPMMTNFPQAWIDQYVGLGLDADDPLLLASRTAITGFRWGDLDALVGHKREYRAHMAAARRSGMADGFCVPIHTPCNRAGAVGFSVARGDALPEAHLPLAEVAAHHAYAAALRIVDAGETVERVKGIEPSS